MTNDEFRTSLRALGISQRWLAERLGVHKSTVSHWATGAAPIPKYAAEYLRVLPLLCARGGAIDDVLRD